MQNGIHEFLAKFLGELHQQFTSILILFIERQAHSQAKFSVVLKQRVRPGRAASEIILGPRRGGQVAAIDGGAARCVRDDCPVAKELRDEFDIRRFTASRAGTGEFKQRAKQLRILDG